MSKAQETRAKIIQQAAELFNQQGYSGSSIADVMEATGLKKGGIYNHFQSKEELALEAFDYAYSLTSKMVWQAMRQKRSAKERLQAMISSHLNYIDNPPIAGGCPILNTAIDSDDTHPALRDRARDAMNSWHNLIIRIVCTGIKKGEIKSEIEPELVATILISTIEGAVMMSKLYQDALYLERAVEHLYSYIEKL